MSVTNHLFSGGQPILPSSLFQQLWSKHGKTHSKADLKNIQIVKGYTFAPANKARLIG